MTPNLFDNYSMVTVRTAIIPETTLLIFSLVNSKPEMNASRRQVLFEESRYRRASETIPGAFGHAVLNILHADRCQDRNKK